MGLKLPRSVRRVTLGGMAAVGVMLLSGCSKSQTDQIKRLAMPIPITKEAPHTHALWMWAWLVAAIVGVIVWGLILYCVFRFRRRSDDEFPVQIRYNLPIEILYTVAPILGVVVFFSFTIRTQDQVKHDFAHPDQTVLVVGQQWSWTFNYENESAVGGKTVYDVGTTAQRPTLWLVKDAKTEFHLYSPDVIHSFWVPSFLYKEDVVPGRDNHFGVVPDRYGTYDGRCAELCGVYHSRMLFNVKIVTQAQFDQHMLDLEAAGNVGLNKGNAHVTIQPGLTTSEGGEQ